MPFASNITSPTHLLVLFLVVLLVFGTKKLPELGRGIGSAMREFKDGVTGNAPALDEPVPAAEPVQPSPPSA